MPPDTLKCDRRHFRRIHSCRRIHSKLSRVHSNQQKTYAGYTQLSAGYTQLYAGYTQIKPIHSAHLSVNGAGYPQPEIILANHAFTLTGVSPECNRSRRLHSNRTPREAGAGEARAGQAKFPGRAPESPGRTGQIPWARAREPWAG